MPGHKVSRRTREDTITRAPSQGFSGIGADVKEKLGRMLGI
jgi:hypothetical protein